MLSIDDIVAVRTVEGAPELRKQSVVQKDSKTLQGSMPFAYTASERRPNAGLGSQRCPQLVSEASTSQLSGHGLGTN